MVRWEGFAHRTESPSDPSKNGVTQKKVVLVAPSDPETPFQSLGLGLGEMPGPGQAFAQPGPENRLGLPADALARGPGTGRESWRLDMAVVVKTNEILFGW